MTNYSLPTIIRTTTFEEEKSMTLANSARFLDILSEIDPELWRIQKHLEHYSIRGDIVPFIIKAVGDICYSSRRGRVIIYIEPNKDGEPTLTQIRAEDVQSIEQKLVKEKS